MRIKQLKVGEDARGIDITVPVFTIVGQRSGAPKTYIQASMHAAELQGNAVIHQLLQYLEATPPQGDVTIVPCCNPIGLNYKVGEYTHGRFDPITGENWNRNYHHPDQAWIQSFAADHHSHSKAEIKALFRQAWLQEIQKALDVPGLLSRGQYMAYQLQQFACEAEYVLDLHTASKAARYLYVPEYAKASAEYFYQEHILLMESRFNGALDEAMFNPWLLLEAALKALGHKEAGRPSFESFTVELGDQEQIDQHAAQQSAQGIMAYLGHKQVVKESAYPAPKLTRHYGRLYPFYAPMGGLYEFKVNPGESVKTGQVIAECLRVTESGTEMVPITSPIAGIVLLHFASSAVPMGAELIKLLI